MWIVHAWLDRMDAVARWTEENRSQVYSDAPVKTCKGHSDMFDALICKKGCAPMPEETPAMILPIEGEHKITIRVTGTNVREIYHNNFLSASISAYGNTGQYAVNNHNGGPKFEETVCCDDSAIALRTALDFALRGTNYTVGIVSR